MATRSCKFALGWLFCAALVSQPAMAGEFSVNPVRLELGAAARSGAITVRNDGKQPLSFQLQAMEWIQDANGKDQYLETQDLIFFPKILTVEPGQDGLVRVGTKTPIVPSEKTYRLYIEELPVNIVRTPETKGAHIDFLIRFGAPIFITPLKPHDALDIERVALEHGELAVSARNSGNRHQVVEGLYLRGTNALGEEVYAITLADRYLLAGTAKSYTTSIDADKCAKLVTVEVELKTDKLSAKRKLTVTPAMCAPK